ncbi:MAG: CoA-binding protein [Candidatus Bathyarchaeota archaeon]
MNEKTTKHILENFKTIAIVGLSRNPKKSSHQVAKYLQSKNYNIIPVNPNAKEILGKKAYKNLLEIQEPIEIIDIFRPSEQVLSIVQEAIQLKEQEKTPKVIWMQLDITNQKAANLAKKAGLIVVMNKCIMKEHKKLHHKKILHKHPIHIK